MAWNFPERAALYSAVFATGVSKYRVIGVSRASKVVRVFEIGKRIRSWKRPACCVTAILVSSVAAQAAVAAAAAAAPEPGIWQQHQYSFAFLGFTSTYSCDGLADKLKVLLLAAGARADVKSTPGACAAEFGRPDKFARADLSFYTLVPGGSATGAAATPVQGVWRSVDFEPHEPRELGIGDCELVEQFRDSVLPMFATRNLDSHTTCIPHEESGSTLALKFEAFAAAPAVPAVAAAAH
jgi:hypothetical protein